MVEITKRALLGASGFLTLAAGAAQAAENVPTGGPFVTKHSGVFNGKKVDYIATVGETVVAGADGQPTIRFVTTSYVKAGGDPKTRPVLFAFNGGPSSSSSTLHMVALGPKRIAVEQDPAAPAPAPSMTDNPLTVLDVADIVFIDPAETGFTRILPNGKREYFYSIEGDAQSVSDFVVAWIKANGREASPKYVLGESYGTQRAAFMAGQLARVMPLDGVFLFGQAVNMIETSQRAKNVLAYATNLPALAVIAAHHGLAPAWKGKSPDQVVEESYAFGMGEYLRALLQGYDLPEADRKAMADKLADMTGISADYYLANDLIITKMAFAVELLKSKGQMMGIYDARYVGPFPKAGERLVDPFGKARAAIEPMMQKHLAENLGVTWPLADYRPLAPGSNAWTWGGTLGPGGPFLDYDYPARINVAFKANPNFRLMIGTGVHDLTTTAGPARYMVTKSDWPRDRIFQRLYFGGHMAYTHQASHKAFCDDIRAWVSGGKPAPQGRLA